jgi:hypothetical protein
MYSVGFCGGSAVRELGPASDMQVFFGCLRLAIPHLAASDDTGLLTDRLYRRYLRLEELEPATALLTRVRKILRDLPAKSIDWESMGWVSALTRLSPSDQTVDLVVHRYLKGAQDLIENARSYEKRFLEYRPAMTIISDLPRFAIDDRRPLAEYDALEGEPIWLRQ